MIVQKVINVASRIFLKIRSYSSNHYETILKMKYLDYRIRFTLKSKDTIIESKYFMFDLPSWN